MFGWNTSLSAREVPGADIEEQRNNNGHAEKKHAMLTEDHKLRMADGRRRWREKRNEVKRQTAEGTVGADEQEFLDAFKERRVIRRVVAPPEEATAPPEEATLNSLHLDITSDQLLRLAEHNLEAAKALTESALAILRSERAKQLTKAV